MTDYSNNKSIFQIEGKWWELWILFIVLSWIMVFFTIDNQPIDKHPIPRDWEVRKFILLAAYLAFFGFIVYVAVFRLKDGSPFAFSYSTVFGNIGSHILVFTVLISMSLLFFWFSVLIMIQELHIPIFQSGCKVRDRDITLFIWRAMAKGTLEFIAGYIPNGNCTPNIYARETEMSELAIRWYTTLVTVWFGISLARAWYRKIFNSGGTS